MDPKRALVIYYSRTGTTHDAASAIRDELGCEMERILDRKQRLGFVGYLRSAFDATFHRSTVLAPMSTTPSDYELVIVGTPIWNASVSAPVRTYLQANRDRIRHVAFFCTCGGSGSARVFGQMEALCGQRPVATLVVTAAEVQRAEHDAKARAFAAALKSSSWTEPTARSVNLRTVPG